VRRVTCNTRLPNHPGDVYNVLYYMSQGQTEVVHKSNVRDVLKKGHTTSNDDFVLEKSIFNNVFEKDIRRVFIYKKAERLAKAIHLIAPAFSESIALHDRVAQIAVSIVDAAVLPSGTARSVLSRELLALSSVLSIARTGNLLSAMNVELITREAHLLLQEIAEYEEPRLFLDETPTLSHLAKEANRQESASQTYPPATTTAKLKDGSRTAVPRKSIKDGQDVKDTRLQDRREAILSVIRDRKTASIKDISAHVRDVSEKTIQRELLTLISLGVVRKEGERRWSTYALS